MNAHAPCAQFVRRIFCMECSVKKHTIGEDRGNAKGVRSVVAAFFSTDEEPLKLRGKIRIVVIFCEEKNLKVQKSRK